MVQAPLLIRRVRTVRATAIARCHPRTSDSARRQHEAGRERELRSHWPVPKCCSGLAGSKNGTVTSEIFFQHHVLGKALDWCVHDFANNNRTNQWTAVWRTHSSMRNDASNARDPAPARTGEPIDRSTICNKRSGAIRKTTERHTVGRRSEVNLVRKTCRDRTVQPQPRLARPRLRERNSTKNRCRHSRAGKTVS